MLFSLLSFLLSPLPAEAKLPPTPPPLEMAQLDNEEAVAWRSGSLGTLATTLAKLGEYERAEELLQQIEDPSVYFSGWVAVGETLALAGEWQRLSQLIRSIESKGQQGLLWQQITQRLIAAEAWEEVEELVSRLEGNLQEEVRFQYAIALTETEDVERVLPLLESLTPDYQFTVRLRSAIQWAKLGQVEQGLAMAEKITIPEPQAYLLSEMALHLAERGNREQADEMVARVLSILKQLPEGSQDAVKRQIIPYWIKVGELEQALALLDELEPSGGTEELRMDLAIALAEQGEMNRAFEINAQIENPELQESSRQEIAIILVKKGDLERGVQLIEKDPNREFAISKIIRALLADKKLTEGINLTETLEDPIWMVSSYTQVIIALIQQKKTDQALAFFQDLPEKLPSDQERVESNRVPLQIATEFIEGLPLIMATELIKIQNLDLALEVTEFISNEELKIQAFREISYLLIDQKQTEPAFNILQKLEDPVQKVTAFTVATSQLLESQQMTEFQRFFETTYQLTRSLPNSEQRALILSSLALQILEKGGQNNQRLSRTLVEDALAELNLYP